MTARLPTEMESYPVMECGMRFKDWLIVTKVLDLKEPGFFPILICIVFLKTIFAQPLTATQLFNSSLHFLFTTPKSLCYMHCSTCCRGVGAKVFNQSQNISNLFLNILSYAFMHAPTDFTYVFKCFTLINYRQIFKFTN